MGYKAVAKQLQGQIKTLVAKGEVAAKISADTAKEAGSIVADTFKSLTKGKKEVPMDLLASTKAGFEKAKADGIKAVLRQPAAYLPTTDKLSTSVKQSMSELGATGEKILKKIKAGAADVQSEFKGEPKIATTAKKTAKTARKKVAVVKKRIKAAT